MPTQHDVMVANQINQYIQNAYNFLSRNKGTPTVSEVLDKAQVDAQNGRKGSFDLVGRDTEYYLKSRHEVARRGFDFPQGGGCFGADLRDLDTSWKTTIAAGGTFLNIYYNSKKAIYIGAGQERKMRTDPDVMVSPPGGIAWGTKGAFDGVSDVGSAAQMPTLLVVPNL
jgi:hypothetical protein